MTTIFTNTGLHLYLHEESVPVIELNWVGYLTGQAFRESVVKAVELVGVH